MIAGHFDSNQKPKPKPKIKQTNQSSYLDTWREAFDNNNIMSSMNSELDSNKVLKETRLAEIKMDELKGLKEQYSLLLSQQKEKEEQHKMQQQQQPNENLKKNINVQTQDGTFFYINNQKIAQPYSNQALFESIQGKNNCPSSFEKIDNETINQYEKGLPMMSGQSCGNEGSSVFVNTIFPTNVKPTFQKCVDDPTHSIMTTATSTLTSNNNVNKWILNGDFLVPRLQKNQVLEIKNNNYQVPNWNANALLINQSDILEYPLPYPKGEQAISLQTNQSISQTIKGIVSDQYILSFFWVGRKEGANPLTIELVQTTTTTTTPTVLFSMTETNGNGVWTQKKTSPITLDSKESYLLRFTGTSNQSSFGTAIQNIQLISSSEESSSTSLFSWKQCKEYAEQIGSRFFSLQSPDSSSNPGTCSVSNDPQILLGKEATIVSGGLILWSSKTEQSNNNSSGSGSFYAMLNHLGQLIVNNAENIALFQTPVDSTIKSNYIGCYVDKSQRAMNNGYFEQKYDYGQCQQLAETQKFSYFALQNSGNGSNAQCFLSNDLNASRQYGKATNCTNTNNNGIISGSAWSNAIYNNQEPTSEYFLILEDSGDMSIYRGSNPTTDNQGLIWSSQGQGQNQNQEKQSNTQYEAIKGKFGQNWISSVSQPVLAIGDWIGSPSGNIYLKMESNGNLNLYTSQTVQNCQKNNNTWIAGSSAQAIYSLGESQGYPNNLAKGGIVDKNSELTLFESNDFSNQNKKEYVPLMHTRWTETGTLNEYENQTLDSCQIFCNESPDCGGIMLNPTTKKCQTKRVPTSDERKQFQTSPLFEENVYLQGKITTNPKSKPIDSILFEHYRKKDTQMKEGFTHNSLSSTREHLETQIKLLAQQIEQQTNELMNQGNKATNQININTVTIEKQKKKFNELMTQFKKEQNKQYYDSFLEDSNLRTLQDNYLFILWSLIAIGVILLAVKTLSF